MNESNDNERLFIAKCALVLFIMGFLVPFLIATFVVALAGPRAGDTAAPLAAGFGFVCEVLAFILGIVGRRHISGKIGMFGGIIVLATAIALATIAALKYSAARADAEVQMEKASEAVEARHNAK